MLYKNQIKKAIRQNQSPGMFKKKVINSSDFEDRKRKHNTRQENHSFSYGYNQKGHNDNFDSMHESEDNMRVVPSTSTNKKKKQNGGTPSSKAKYIAKKNKSMMGYNIKQSDPIASFI